MAKTPEAEIDVLNTAVADHTTLIEAMQPAGSVETESYSEPDLAFTFAKDLQLALNEYQPDLKWLLNPASTEPMLQNGLLVTPSIDLLQSVQQKKLLWLCLQQES